MALCGSCIFSFPIWKTGLMTHCNGSTQHFIAAGNHHVLLQRHTLSTAKKWSFQDLKCSSARFSAGVVHWSCEGLLRYLNIYPAFKYLSNIESVSQHLTPSPLGMCSHVGGRAPGSCCCLTARDCRDPAASPATPRWDGAQGGLEGLEAPFLFLHPLLSPLQHPLSPTGLLAAQPQDRISFASPQAQH